MTLKVMNFAYWHSTHVLSVVNMGLKMTSAKEKIRVFTLGLPSICTEYGLET